MYENNNELQHYGVVGMKWGKRKALKYSRDINQYRYNAQKREQRLLKNQNKISKEQYKSNVKKLKSEHKTANKQAKQDLKQIKVDRTKKAEEIYNGVKNKAYTEIPHYTLKKGARGVSAGITAMEGVTVGALAALGVASGVGAVAAAPVLATYTADRAIRKKISKATM